MPSRALRQPLDDGAAQRVVADDEGAHVDALARAVDHLPQRLARGLAVGMQADRAAPRRRKAEALDQIRRPVSRRHRARRPRRARRAQLALAEQQVDRQDEVGHEHQPHDPCNGRGGRALLAARARGQHIDQQRKGDDKKMLGR
jgi:hypothetical protein